jgi:hypothetical protein
MLAHRHFQLGDRRLTPDKAGGLRPQVSQRLIKRPQRRKLLTQHSRAHLKHLDRSGQIPQPSRSQIDEVYAAEQTCRRLDQQDLTAMPRGHHPCRTVEHRTEVVRTAQLGFAGRDTHPYRQLKRPSSHARPRR